jgi:hypothetical protein
MDMYTVPVAGMIFVLLIVLIGGGFKLLGQMGPRLGAAMDQWLAERRARSLVSAEEVAELRRTVDELQRELLRLSEQQQFTERLLEDRSPVSDVVGEPD